MFIQWCVPAVIVQLYLKIMPLCPPQLGEVLDSITVYVAHVEEVGEVLTPGNQHDNVAVWVRPLAVVHELHQV